MTLPLFLKIVLLSGLMLMVIHAMWQALTGRELPFIYRLAVGVIIGMAIVADYLMVDQDEYDVFGFIVFALFFIYSYLVKQVSFAKFRIPYIIICSLGLAAYMIIAIIRQDRDDTIFSLIIVLFAISTLFSKLPKTEMRVKRS